MACLAFLTPLVVRALLTLLLPHTYFQPDEFYQALEPAHYYVFGYGYLSWEWRDLPLAETLVSTGTSEFHGKLWNKLVEVAAGGRMRGWAWPGIFVVIYEVLKGLKLDRGLFLTMSPRAVGVIVAVLTDYYTYCLSSKLLGHGSAPTALFLSLTSLFNAHLLPRSLSTSPETLLTLMALYYFPFPAPGVPQVNGLHNVTNLKLIRASKGETGEGEKELIGVKDSDKRFYGVNDLDYVVIDRTPPFVVKTPQHKDKLALSVCLATIALCIRPTMVSLWAFLGVNLLWRRFQTSGLPSLISTTALAISSIFCTVAGSAAIDYLMTGRLYVPLLTFIYQNVIANISSFYGSTNHLYHLVQSLPIMLFPLWIWWAKGFIACMLPTGLLPAQLNKFDKPEGLRILAKAITFTVAALSLSPHSEWRFLHPLLPPLLLYAIPSFSISYTPTVLGAYYPVRSFRQYLRMDKVPFYVILFSGIVPFIYLNVFHGAAQVEVMNVLRRGDLGNVTSLAVLAPCHSTPWMSHLHKDIEGWFLTCEPPVGVDAKMHRTQQDWFYSNPVQYLSAVFPYPPSQLHDIPYASFSKTYPSHIILFGELLSRHGVVSETILEADESQPVMVTTREGDVVGELESLGYQEVWNGWNGFDWAQDEEERKGGVRVWRRLT
ncbi:phosphatidylinositol glycan, class B [Cryptococcus neoformans C23]|uniref:Mannosyltransferase n=1 Tax=Cryptococcus neoformans (strain H99 / ATCC 208821 / CBS 10515 / FGSC 9487) TaxID=235443 RepID=J9VMG6_CRYN9|nr:phosphatidylinositol glycan, class B [Cryptococcus neoformans var. grubii H99]AUB23376.1 phosphatidylinositol glycan, class B [Cryptococcus neoformans var. grubii]OWZ34374.1 phosphatidylinositol glycan, class B [Cryptococcus neoformans var. grubii AD2-60a]OWZ46458.1 phosphatidylinositol glycan, class B [Cryptococcus neoformans var. grubii C23]OXG34794.1 phosphatidylinositol glycan, class B [Cryptococcus neoformans var. grubii Bt120]OXG37969.1 phosphatidylinositol glycan, class B [Cryptococc|eukprot:XP_012047859.1 phosphatidylinositol glycan, class B [Cryptococcus neoformans var. grubii H99]